jgi:hypothetical protein
MRRRKPKPIRRILVGWVPVFTRKVIVMDPAFADCFVSDKPSRKKKQRDFTFSGACAATRTRHGAAELLAEGATAAVVARAPKNRNYPVYALVRGRKVLRLVIVFDADPCREAPRTRKRG